MKVSIIEWIAIGLGCVVLLIGGGYVAVKSLSKQPSQSVQKISAPSDPSPSPNKAIIPVPVVSEVNPVPQPQPPIIKNETMKFEEGQDEFSSKVKRKLKFLSENKRAMFIVSRIGDEYELQLSTKDVLFPDAIKHDPDSMILSITFKSDFQKEANTSAWHMNIMKYENAWYTGDSKSVVFDLVQSKKLSLKTNNRGDVYRFDLAGIEQYADKFK